MAVYDIDHTSGTTILASIKSAFSTAGILTTTHRDTSTFLIVTTTRSTRVLSFNAPGSGRLFMFYGTSYNTGDTINDSVTLQNHGFNTGDAGVVVITDDAVVISQRRGSGSTYGFLVGNANDGSSTNLIWSWASNTGGAGSTTLHNAAARTQQNGVFFGAPLISAGGFYYYADIPNGTTSGNILGTGIKGVKQLLKGNTFTAAHEVVGDDIIVPGGFSNAGSLAIPTGFYIVDGNSWEPA
jgi:hypothetical protein